MEVRKVHRAGGTSLSLIVPKAWADRVGLEPGDAVGCVEQCDGALAVWPDHRSEDALRTVDLPAAGATLTRRQVLSAYLRGYDRIRIQADDRIDGALAAAIREAARDLVGLEVVERGERVATLEHVLETGEMDPEQALRRMELLAQGLVRTAARRLADPDEDLPAALDRREDEIDQLARRVTRNTHVALRDAGEAAKLGLHSSDAVQHLLASRRVERAADHAHGILNLLRSRDLEASAVRERLAQDLDEAGGLLERAVHQYHDGDPGSANDTVEAARGLATDHPDLLQAAAREEAGSPALVRIAYHVGRVGSLSGDIAELALNRTIDPPVLDREAAQSEAPAEP